MKTPPKHSNSTPKKMHTRQFHESTTFEDDMELFDMLCVALYFAGARQEFLQQVLEEYGAELDGFDDDEPYGQEQIIEVIKRIRVKRPDFFTP